jgi:hypothetical protein
VGRTAVDGGFETAEGFGRGAVAQPQENKRAAKRRRTRVVGVFMAPREVKQWRCHFGRREFMSRNETASRE